MIKVEVESCHQCTFGHHYGDWMNVTDYCEHPSFLPEGKKMRSCLQDAVQPWCPLR